MPFGNGEEYAQALEATTAAYKEADLASNRWRRALDWLCLGFAAAFLGAAATWYRPLVFVGVAGLVIFYAVRTLYDRKMSRRLAQLKSEFDQARDAYRRVSEAQSAAAQAELVDRTRNTDIAAEREDGRIDIVAADFEDGSSVATVTEWLVAAGDEVELRQPIASVMYDSWTLEFIATIDGRVDEILVPQAEEVPLETPLCILSPR